MKNKNKFLISFFVIFLGLLVGSSSFAKSSLTGELMGHHWVGASQFMKQAQAKKINMCSFLIKQEKDSPGFSYVQRRILMLSAKTKCSFREALAKKYLQDEDIAVVRDAMALAASLPKKNQRHLASVVKKAKIRLTKKKK